MPAEFEILAKKGYNTIYMGIKEGGSPALSEIFAPSTPREMTALKENPVWNSFWNLAGITNRPRHPDRGIINSADGRIFAMVRRTGSRDIRYESIVPATKRRGHIVKDNTFTWVALQVTEGEQVQGAMKFEVDGQLTISSSVNLDKWLPIDQADRIHAVTSGDKIELTIPDVRKLCQHSQNIIREVVDKARNSF